MIEFEGRKIPSELSEIVDPAHTVLLVWDMQNDQAGGSFNKNELIRNAPPLIMAAREARIKTVYTRQTPYLWRDESPAWIRRAMKERLEDAVGGADKAVVKALLYIRANREGSIDIIMRHGKLEQREIAATLYDLMRDAYEPALSAQGVMKRAELEFAVLKERPNFKPELFIDDRFFKAALRSLRSEQAR